MIQREVTITNSSGLHARPATFFIQKANTYRSSVWVVKDDRKVSAKSLLGVLSIGIAKGMTITLAADGEDEKEAIDGLRAGYTLDAVTVSTDAAVDELLALVVRLHNGIDLKGDGARIQTDLAVQVAQVHRGDALGLGQGSGGAV